MTIIDLLAGTMLLFLASPLISMRKKEVHFERMRNETMMIGNILAEKQEIISRRFNLSGTPDRIMGTQDSVVPMMFRDIQSTEGPKISHMIQMGTYFIILPEIYPGMYVRYGVLNYADSKYMIHNTLMLKDLVLSRLDELSRTDSLPTRNHDDPERCKGCPYVSACRQRLIE